MLRRTTLEVLLASSEAGRARTMAENGIFGPLRLRFDEQKLEQDFAEYCLAYYFRYTQITLGLAAVLLLGDFTADFLQNPQIKVNLLRLGVSIPLVIATFLYTFAESAKRHWQTAMSVFVVATAASLFYILMRIDLAGGNGLHSWVGILNFVFLSLFAMVILGIQFIYAVTSCTLMLMLFLFATYESYRGEIGQFIYFTYQTITFFILALLIGWYREFLIRREFVSLMTVSSERQRNQSLLEAILPPHIVSRIKNGETSIAENYGEVTILFTDLHGFTSLAARMGPRHLIETLDRIFTEFDRICARHGVDKIKTIGDSYMAVSGLTSSGPNHARNAMLAAREMVTFLDMYAAGEALPIGIRVGLHTGPVIGGVIGETKPQFDLWGESVNLASRMESHGKVGFIQVTEPVWYRLQKEFQFSQLTTISAKGVGEVSAFLHDPASLPRLDSFPP